MRGADAELVKLWLCTVVIPKSIHFLTKFMAEFVHQESFDLFKELTPEGAELLK